MIIEGAKDNFSIIRNGLSIIHKIVKRNMLEKICIKEYKNLKIGNYYSVIKE